MQPNAAPDAGPPPPDPESLRRVELARAFAFHLLKGIKQIGMYRHNEARYAEYLAPAHQALTAFLDACGPLMVRVEQQNLMLGESTLFAEDSTVPYRFHRDGVRRLIFRPGFTPEELVSFTLIAVSDGERGEDLLAQLWRTGLEHLETVAVEGFQVDEVSEEQVQVEVDDIVGFLQSQLQGTSTDIFRYARLSTDDLDVKLEGISALRGAVVRGVTAPDALKARVQQEIAEDDKRVFPKLVTVLFQLLESAGGEAQTFEEVFSQVLDAMLLQEDFSTILQILFKVRALEQRSANNESLARLRQAIVARMSEEQRLSRLAEILRSRKPQAPQDVLRYVQSLEPRVVPTLLTELDTIELPESRQLLLDALLPFAREQPDAFLHRLGSDRAPMVRDMVYVLEKIEHPDRVKHYGAVLQHKSLAVRLEAMGVLARAKSGEARKLISQALFDPVAQVRILAARLLPEFDQERAYQELTALIRDPGFEKKPAEEKAAVWGAIGSTGQEAAFALFTERMAQKGNLLNRKKLQDEKLLAIAGLEGACSVQAYRILQGIVDDKAQPVEVLTAARRAMYATKKALFGDAGPAEPQGGGSAGGPVDG